MPLPALISVDQLNPTQTKQQKHQPSPPSSTVTVTTLSATDDPSSSSSTTGSLSMRSVPSSATAHKHPPPLIRFVHSLYTKWACFIVKNAWAVILICTLVTTLCTVKVALTP
ncbi:hypothetical protein niasHT_036340 [Heterodera trifolii]|uniref:Uncharacterized protein n=1 Tax=Heterodera trifolii TaxID=157864 RepID=A0ABD2J6L8_9BILA